MVKIALAADQATVHSGKLPLLVPHATLSPAREMSPSARAIPARLEKTKTGAGPLSIREIARRAERDVKAVHALLDAGILDRTEGGEIVFPYEAVHVDFTLYAAA